MRDFKGMKRQRGRNRRSGGGQGGGQSNNPNRAFDSNGPEGIKVRGNAQTVYERYQQLARDATSAGDRILAENYLQHAEHYFRLLRIMQPTRPVHEIAAREGGGQGFDIDFEDESGVQAAQFAAAAAQEQQAAQDAQSSSEGEDGRREGRRDREDRQRDDRPREDRQRDDRPREERAEGEGGRRESRRERYERRRSRNEGEDGQAEGAADPLAVIEPGPAAAPADDAAHMPSFLTRAAPSAAEEGGEEPAPRRRGRPRKAEAEPSGDEG